MTAFRQAKVKDKSLFDRVKTGTTGPVAYEKRKNKMGISRPVTPG